MDNNKRIIDGVTVLATDRLHSKWIEETGHLAHDQYLKEKLRPYIKEGDTVIDIGAHIGTHSIMYSQWAGKTGKVHAFEPNLPVFECLSANMATHPNVKCYNVGVSDKDEQVSMNHNPENPGASYINGPGNIPLIRLDNLHLKPNFIKIDAEGWEPKVLAGCRHTIKEHRPYMFIEINRSALKRQGFEPEDIYNFLITFGYTYRNITDDEGLAGEQFDIICIP